MSVNIDWETVTSGPDGDALAEKIRSFIDDKFQQVALPRFIRSVQVQSFDFGTVCPEIEIKDLCDPFTDFYEEDEDGDFSDSDSDLPQESLHNEALRRTRDQLAGPSNDFDNGMARDSSLRIPTDANPGLPSLRSPINFGDRDQHLLPRSGTPGIPGGTSNLSYYYMSLGGLSGSQTPLAAVAGGNPFPRGWPDSATNPQDIDSSQRGTEGIANQQRHQQQYNHHQPRIEVEADSISPSRPSTSSTLPSATSNIEPRTLSPPGGSDHQAHIPLQQQQHDPDIPGATAMPPPPRMREQKTDDLQVVCRLKYSGDITLSLTAEILLDYPMPSFVGLPLKLNITGLTFDGVAVLAYIRRRAHFCFLSPEDADALLGPEENADVDNAAEEASAHHHPGLRSGAQTTGSSMRRKNGGLLQQIRVESEIGRKENGKQVLKNVGKVERFVLQEVRRIFEDEFVFPSFWTFLI